MNGQPDVSISFGDPLRRAWQRMVLLLFSPFEWARWFSLGFCAWLASLGEGGYNFSFNMPGGSGERDWTPPAEMPRVFHDYLGLIVALASVLVVLVVAVVVALVWVGSRGHFMFLSNVVRNEDHVAAPWREYRREGNSLFFWRLVFGIICLAAALLIAGGVLLSLWPVFSGKAGVLERLGVIIAGAALFLLLVLASGYISMLANNFVTPVMYRNRLPILDAWRAFLPVAKAYFWHFVLFALLLLGLHLALLVAVVAFTLLTCCCGGILLAIPYVGTVILLPVLVFFRALGLEFLRQFGPEFDVYPAPPPLQAAPEVGTGSPPP